MSHARPPSFSLSAVRPGQCVVIRRILFDGPRGRCADLELREGEEVCCRAAGSYLMLETPQGRVVSLDRNWARFIEVSREVSGRLKDPG